MNEITIFIIGLSVTISISFLIVAYIKIHLKNILTEICGSSSLSDFWVSFSSVALIMIPVIFAMYAYPHNYNGPPSFIFEIVKLIRWALAGLLSIFSIIGMIIIKETY